jgi:hypothetical protein
MNHLWPAFKVQFKLSWDEIARLEEEGLAQSVAEGRREPALVRLALLRPPSSGRAAHEEKVSAERAEMAVVGGTAAERRAARLLALLAARRAEADPGVRNMRKFVIGQTAPLSPAKAWAMLKALPASDTSGDIFTFPDERGRERAVRVRDDALGGLAVWASQVAVLFAWSQSDAAWFLLTGSPPRLAPVVVSIEAPPEMQVVDGVRCAVGGRPVGATLTATAPPSTSGKSIAATVDAARRQLFKARRGRLPVGRQAAMEFVKGEPRVGGRIVWEESNERWRMLAPPEWHYPDGQALRRACQHEGLAPGTKRRGAPSKRRRARSR